MTEMDRGITEREQQRVLDILLPILEQGFGSPDQAAETMVHYLDGRREEYSVPAKKFQIVVSIESGSGGIGIFVWARADDSSFKIDRFKAAKYPAFEAQDDAARTNLIINAANQDLNASSNFHLLEEAADRINSNDFEILYKQTDAAFSGLR